MANSISEQTKIDALKIAKGTQKPGQTKEQTKIISQGIEKGIANYKKQQKAKAREADKSRKQTLKAKHRADAELIEEVIEETNDNRFFNLLPWTLLVVSWIGFIALYLKQ